MFMKFTVVWLRIHCLDEGYASSLPDCAGPENKLPLQYLCARVLDLVITRIYWFGSLIGTMCTRLCVQYNCLAGTVNDVDEPFQH